MKNIGRRKMKLSVHAVWGVDRQSEALEKSVFISKRKGGEADFVGLPEGIL